MTQISTDTLYRYALDGSIPSDQQHALVEELLSVRAQFATLNAEHMKNAASVAEIMKISARDKMAHSVMLTLIRLTLEKLLAVVQYGPPNTHPQFALWVDNAKSLSEAIGKTIEELQGVRR